MSTDEIASNDMSLFDACCLGLDDSVEQLLKRHGKDINVNVRGFRFGYLVTPLMLRSTLLFPRTVTLLLAHPSVDIHATTCDGDTALHRVCRYICDANSDNGEKDRYIASAKLLVGRGASLTLENAHGETPLAGPSLDPAIASELLAAVPMAVPGEMTKSASKKFGRREECSQTSV